MSRGKRDFLAPVLGTKQIRPRKPYILRDPPCDQRPTRQAVSWTPENQDTQNQRYTFSKVQSLKEEPSCSGKDQNLTKNIKKEVSACQV